MTSRTCVTASIAAVTMTPMIYPYRFTSLCNKTSPHLHVPCCCRALSSDATPHNHATATFQVLSSPPASIEVRYSYSALYTCNTGWKSALSAFVSSAPPVRDVMRMRNRPLSAASHSCLRSNVTIVQSIDTCTHACTHLSADTAASRILHLFVSASQTEADFPS
ncbi:hypothetical protein CTRI78_v010492 [Colletotrichum trifolii]|uniref:Uncharacterized protein n=1 Tax=Colletotrichum trifolii TaxID=5466 RepID=A0A4R8QL52_COLTR|nr:hypothetical protein CTRI78_v010492 [Colletotrichum trifolii]